LKKHYKISMSLWNTFLAVYLFFAFFAMLIMVFYPTWLMGLSIFFIPLVIYYVFKNNTKLSIYSFFIFWLVLGGFSASIETGLFYLFVFFLPPLAYKARQHRLRKIQIKTEATHAIKSIKKEFRNVRFNEVKNLLKNAVKAFEAKQYDKTLEFYNQAIQTKVTKIEELRRLRFEKTQRAKGLIKYVTADGEEKWGKPEEVKKWKEAEIGLENNFANLSPFEFEDFIAKLFEKIGYKTQKMRNTGDYGCDILATDGKKNVVIQCKKNKEGNLVGNQAVQQTLGSMWKFKAKKAILVTTSDFTPMAREQAEGAPIELWNKKVLHEMVRRYLIES
jgi:restriction system protein